MNLDTFVGDVDQVEHLVKWWISRKPIRYHRIRLRGDVYDFINEVWCRILHGFRDGRSVGCSLTTAVFHQCEWELANPYRGNWKHWVRATRRPRSTDHVDESDQAGEYAENSDMKHCIAAVMRSIPRREAAVVRARYGLFGDKPLTLKQIGKILKINRARVWQLEVKGVHRMQGTRRHADLLRQFLDTKLEKD